MFREKQQASFAVVGILPTSVIYGRQVVTEDDDKGCILWDVGTILPAEYFPIMEQEVYNEITSPLKVAAAA